MFQWFKNLIHKQPELPVDTAKLLLFLADEDALIRAQSLALVNMQYQLDDLSAIVTSLLLNNGGTEYLIKNEFMKTFQENKMIVCYKREEDGVKVWLETQHLGEVELPPETENDEVE